MEENGNSSSFAFTDSSSNRSSKYFYQPNILHLSIPSSNMRSSIARVARPLASQQLRQFSARAAAAARPSMLAAPSMKKSQKVVAPQWSQMRFASGSSLSKDDIKARVLDVLKSFEKVDPAQVSSEAMEQSKL